MICRRPGLAGMGAALAIVLGVGLDAPVAAQSPARASAPAGAPAATAAPAPPAGPPRLSCKASLSPDRALVTVDLADFFDKELLRLVRLGLEGIVRLELTLVRRRRLWFDESVVSQRVDLKMTYAKALDAFVLDARRVVPDPARLKLDHITLSTGEPLPAGEYRVDAAARVQVVTASSLGRVASWITGRGKDDGAAPNRNILSRNIISALASDLVRSASGGCPVARS